jgi:toxin ParE1/3/4
MNRLKLIISDKAVEDLTNIWTYIALDNDSVADKFIDALYESCKDLAAMPHMGRARDELMPGLRSMSHRGYIIYYLVGPHRLEIVRVLNGCMDVDSMF